MKIKLNFVILQSGNWGFKKEKSFLKNLKKEREKETLDESKAHYSENWDSQRQNLAQIDLN